LVCRMWKMKRHYKHHLSIQNRFGRIQTMIFVRLLAAIHASIGCFRFLIFFSFFFNTVPYSPK